MLLDHKIKYLNKFNNIYKRKNLKIKIHYSILPFLILSNCGGSGANLVNKEQDEVVLASGGIAFVSPQISYGVQNSGQAVNPYWISALIQKPLGENGYLEVVTNTGGGYQYAFPEEQPGYLKVGPNTKGWSPVNEQVKSIYRDIFLDLSQYVNISFLETEQTDDLSIIAIMSNVQNSTTGYAYEPIGVLALDSDYLFSDIFISSDFQNPLFLSDGKTNFNYELLIHELGHAIGLRHPFENFTGDGSYLNSAEEYSQWTAMSYTQDTEYYDGQFRLLDLAAIVSIYGINPTYNSGNDIYKFSSLSGQIIIDGAGIDEISASNQISHAYIDLRENAHSYVGPKNDMITSPFQLSVGNSFIENATGGSGNDWIIGNDGNNYLLGMKGNDVLFGGEGSDIIRGGEGNDVIDLTELNSRKDTILFENSSFNGTDTIYGFDIGIGGDVIDFTFLNNLVFINQVHNLTNSNASINISNQIFRISNNKMQSEEEVKFEFKEGNFSYLELDNGGIAILITSENSDLTQDQYFFQVSKKDENIDVNYLAKFSDINLDIDLWSNENFV